MPTLSEQFKAMYDHYIGNQKQKHAASKKRDRETKDIFPPRPPRRSRTKVRIVARERSLSDEWADENSYPAAACCNRKESIQMAQRFEAARERKRLGLTRTKVQKCKICLEDLCEDETSKMQLDCNHEFHNPCLQTWFQYNPRCPVCFAKS